MSSKYRRTPKNYDGTALTSHHVSQLLPTVLSKINRIHDQRPDLILAAWPTIIGAKLASMTQALSFSEGVLSVAVKNSTLHSLLSQNDKPRILNALRQHFPNVEIKTIYFRIG